VSKVLQIALGILAAIGGFGDIGDIVFSIAAGATFGYELAWAVVLGVGAIIVYSEMCGRVATVGKRAVFEVIRERMGFGVGLGALVASQVVNFMTLAAEIGGVAIVLQLLSGLPYRALILLGAIALAVVLWFSSFGAIERLFGYMGLCLLVFAVGAIKMSPDWSDVGEGFVPHVPSSDLVVYAYFVVGLLGAATVPYEVYFYSSGAVEEGWGPKDLGVNRANAIIGYSLGGLLSIALMMTAAQLFLPRGIDPESLATVALGAEIPLGEIGLILALVGILFAVGGAAVDTSFAGAYNLAQFFGWEWGKYRRPGGAPRFTISWVVLLALGMLVIMSGIDAVMLTEFSVIFSVVALPLTYIPILLVANDKIYMGEYVNGKVTNVLGIFYLFVILIVALAAIPLMILSNMGQG
jgi:Mn2+/Fe2+ NRAMP family transporter